MVGIIGRAGNRGKGKTVRVITNLENGNIGRLGIKDDKEYWRKNGQLRFV